MIARTPLINFIALLSLSACCIGGGINVESSPVVRYYTASGLPIPFREDFLNVTSVYSVLYDKEAIWEVNDAFGGSIPSPEQTGFLEFDAGEVGGLADDGTRRHNVVVISYEFKGGAYADTLRYDSWLDDGHCYTNHKVDPVGEVSGPLVTRWERASDFPGVLIYIRDSL